MYASTEDRDTATTRETRQAQYDAVCAWGIRDHALLNPRSAIGMPVFVANGDSDPMILPHYSYLLAGLIPHAQLKIYPDAAHGFLFQHHAEFATDVDAFLTRDQATSDDPVTSLPTPPKKERLPAQPPLSRPGPATVRAHESS